MSEKCTPIERDATITLGFLICEEHQEARPMGGTVDSRGIPLSHVVEGCLGVAQELLTVKLSTHPAVRALFEGEEMPERAKHRLISLLANQMMLRIVANRDYMSPSESAMLVVDMPE